MPETEESQVRSPAWEDTLEKGKTTHSSILAWRPPGTEEPGKDKEILFVDDAKKKLDPVFSIGSQFITDFHRGYFQIQIGPLSNNPIT